MLSHLGHPGAPKEVFLNHLEVQCGVLGLPLSADSQIKLPVVPLCCLQHVTPKHGSCVYSSHLPGGKSMKGLHVEMLHGPRGFSSHSNGQSSSGDQSEQQKRLGGRLKALLGRGGNEFGSNVVLSVAFRTWRKCVSLRPDLD